MRRRAARLAACLAIAGLTACSLLVDTGGLSGGASDGGGAEGSTPPSTDAPSGGDGPSGDDAAPDAPHDGDASTVFVCDATFCDDFDDGGPRGWTDKLLTRGTITTTNDAVTPPNGLLVQLAAGSGSADVELMKSFSGLPQHMRCELDMKVVNAPPSNAEVDYLEFTTLSTDPKTYSVYFAHFDTGWAVAEFATFGDGGQLDRHSDATPPPIGTWFHVTFQTDGSSVSVAYDGVQASSLGSLTSFGGTERDFNIGIPYVQSSPTVGAHSVEYDDVACYVSP